MGAARAPYMAKTDKERLATGFWNRIDSNQATDCNNHVQSILLSEFVGKLAMAIRAFAIWSRLETHDLHFGTSFLSRTQDRNHYMIDVECFLCSCIIQKSTFSVDLYSSTKMQWWNMIRTVTFARALKTPMYVIIGLPRKSLAPQPCLYFQP